MPHSTDAEQDDSKFTSADESLREGDVGRSMATCVNNNHNVDYHHGSNSSSSDDDEGGECSLDSYQSDKNSVSSSNSSASNANKCQENALPVDPLLTNGIIEVKPCPSVVSDPLRDRISISNDENSDSSPEQQDGSDAGGRLRFYLDGRCVLELRHDFSNDGHPKQWVQSYGKTYRSTVASIPTNWQPQESSNHGLPEEIQASSPTVTSLPSKKKPYNNVCLTFFARNRRESNMKLLPFCVRRKACRRPGEVLPNEPACPHEKRCQKQPNSLRHRASTLFQKTQRLCQIVDKLAVQNCGESLPSLKSDRKSSPLSCLLLGALIQKKGGDSARNSHAKGKNNNNVSKRDEDEKSDKLKPEFYIDPAKSQVHADEVLGNPRPSLPSSPSTTSTSLKRSSDDDSTLNETKKLAKEENDSMDVDVKSQAFSSHCVPHSKASSLDKTPAILPPAKVEAGSAEDGGAVVNSAGRSGDSAQRKKKKGGGYGRGRTIGEAVRTYVISEILNLGGDVRTNYVPRGVFTEVASRYKIDATTTYRWWLKYCNGIRLAATGNLSQPDTSSKAFLSSRAAAAVPMIASEMKARADNLYKEANALHNSRIIESSSTLKRDHSSLLTAGSHSHSLPYGGRYSPRSDDSASSGASLVDPAALYVSSLTLAPHTGVWPTGVPLANLPNGQLPFQTSRLPLPLNVCVPYLWNCAVEQPAANGASKEKQNHSDSRSSPVIHSDEPLDLSVPKKEKKEGSFAQSSKIEDMKVLNSGLGTYSECQSNQYILRTLLSTAQGQGQTAAWSNNLVDKDARYSVGKPFAKSLAQRNMKPKHYPFVSLQIGSFEIHSNLDGTHSSDRDHYREIPNKFKVIFTQRKFVYEFETNAEMQLPSDENNQKESQLPSAKRMACIVVPFNIVEAFWCYGATIVLRVVSKPFMFLGRKLKQVGCVPSLTVYETKKAVDLTGGQLSMAHLHKVTLIKPHLIEQLKIYLVLFDVRFRNLISPVAHSPASCEKTKAADHPETNNPS